MRGALTLLAVFVFLGVFGIRALVQDRAPTFTDAMLPDSLRLYDTLTKETPTAAQWLDSTNYRPPLSYVPGTLFYLAHRPHLDILRFSVLLQYLLLVWMAAGCGALLARRAPGSDAEDEAAAAVVTALTVGTFPMIFGWGRMAYMDFSLATVVMVCLRVLLVTDLDRPWHGARLGAVVGLGLLTKVAFPIFAIAPGLWLLGTRLRRLRHLASLGVATLSALLVAGWWYVAQWDLVLINMRMSSSKPAATLAELGAKLLSGLRVFVWDLPLGPTLLAVALLGGLWAWRRGLLPGQHYLLLAASTVLPLLMLVFFVHLRRYALPVYPLAAVLAAAVLHQAGKRLLPGPPWPRTALLAAPLLAIFLVFNLGWYRPKLPPTPGYRVAGARVDALGMTAPDTRNHSHLMAAIDSARKRGFKDCLAVTSGYNEMERHTALWDMLLLHDDAKGFEIHERLAPIAAGDPEEICVLRITGVDPDYNDWPQATPQLEDNIYHYCLVDALIRANQPTAVLGSWGPTPLDLRYRVLIYPGTLLHKRPRPKPPYCRLDQVFWDKKVNR